MKTSHENDVQEFKDAKKKHRIRVVAKNKNILSSTPQGYFNLDDCIHSCTCSSISLIDYYRNKLTEEQVQDLRDILDSIGK